MCVSARWDVYVSCLAALLLFNSVSHLIYFNKVQLESRPLWGHVLLCLQQYARNFSSIYSVGPIKAALPRMQIGKHLTFVPLTGMVIQQLTIAQQLLIIYSHMFQDWEVSSLDQHVCDFFYSFFDYQTLSHTNTSSIICPTQFHSLRGSVSESRDVTATTWRQETQQVID